MSDSNYTLLRSYACELLAEINDQPHINKERLFTDAMAYYDWLFTNKEAVESLDVYLYEFEGHHRPLVARLEPAIRVACFITWFVENGFHRQLPLKGSDPNDTQTRRTCFSSPSFRLPTGDPAESYLVQWLFWRIDNPPASNTQLEQQIWGWACQLMADASDHLDMDIDEQAELTTCAERFFRWSLASLYVWDAFIELFVAFLQSDSGRVLDPSNIALVDTSFLRWFCEHDLDSDVQDDQSTLQNRSSLSNEVQP